MKLLIAIDPGTDKCGLAIFADDKLEAKMVLERREAIQKVGKWCAEGCQVVIGDGTGSQQFLEELMEVVPNIDKYVAVVDEYYTTQLARERYWQENPPRGWRRFLPVSMQTPPAPYDDYVAVILGERYLAGR